MSIRNHSSLHSRANRTIKCICSTCQKKFGRVYKGIEEQFGLCPSCNGKLIDNRKATENKKLEKARREYEKVMLPFAQYLNSISSNSD